MMSSFETSSPVSASTFRYLMRWPVFRLIWLKLIFSESEVAGYRATGQVTRERRKKPFQLARGAMRGYSKRNTGTGDSAESRRLVPGLQVRGPDCWNNRSNFRLLRRLAPSTCGNPADE